MLVCNAAPTYKIESLEEYKRICIDIEHHLNILCSNKNRFPVICAFNEAVNNAVVHGEFPIAIDVNILTEDELLIKIADSGKGFPAHEKINLIHKNGANQLLEEGIYNEHGRGIYIMFKAVSKVSFNDKGNEVSLFVSNR